MGLSRRKAGLPRVGALYQASSWFFQARRLLTKRVRGFSKLGCSLPSGFVVFPSSGTPYQAGSLLFQAWGLLTKRVRGFSKLGSFLPSGFTLLPSSGAPYQVGAKFYKVPLAFTKRKCAPTKRDRSFPRHSALQPRVADSFQDIIHSYQARQLLTKTPPLLARSWTLSNALKNKIFIFIYRIGLCGFY